jgi:CBS domain-containing protein
MIKEEQLTNLTSLRDAARVRAHLFGMEARERWTELELALDQLERRIAQGTETAADAVSDAARELAGAMRSFLQTHAGLSAPARLLMTTPVVTCTTQDDVNDVAQMFWETSYAAAPVVDASGALQGMLTDRDICMAAYTQGRRLPDISVEKAMSRCVYAAAPDDTVARVLEIMSDAQVHHVPIVDGQRRVVGIISATDVARWALGSPRQREDVNAAALGALVAIAAPSPFATRAAAGAPPAAGASRS